MRISIFIIMALLSSYVVSGQSDPSAIDLRKVSGTGPYPMYFNVKGRLNAMFPMYSDLRKGFDQQNDINGIYADYGFEVDFGVAIRSRKSFLGKNVHGFELGYQFMESAIHKTGSLGMNVAYSHFSLRYNYRVNFIYPITVQVSPALLMYSTERLIRYDYVSTQSLTNANRSSLGRKGDLCSGFEIGTKLMFKDPAGTDGEFGFFLEFTYQFYGGKGISNTAIEEKFGIDDLKPETRQALLFSLGIVIPIAVRA